MHQFARLVFLGMLGTAVASCKTNPSGLSSVAQAQTAVDGASAPTIMQLLTRPNDASDKSHWFIPMPMIRQARNYTCGVASLMSILYYYGDEIREGKLQRLAKSSTDTGTSYRDMIPIINALNGANGMNRDAVVDILACEEEFEPAQYSSCALGLPAPGTGGTSSGAASEPYTIDVHPGLSTDFYPASSLSPEEQGTNVPTDGLTIKDLESHILAGEPVMVDIQAWPDTPMTQDQYYANYADGHYVVAIGFDAKNIYFMDPSTTSSWAYISRADFAKRWHDEDDAPDVAASNTAHCTATANDGTPGVQCLRHFGMIIKRNYRGDTPFDFLSMDTPQLK